MNSEFHAMVTSVLNVFLVIYSTTTSTAAPAAAVSSTVSSNNKEKEKWTQRRPLQQRQRHSGDDNDNSIVNDTIYPFAWQQRRSSVWPSEHARSGSSRQPNTGHPYLLAFVLLAAVSARRRRRCPPANPTPNVCRVVILPINILYFQNVFRKCHRKIQK